MNGITIIQVPAGAAGWLPPQQTAAVQTAAFLKLPQTTSHLNPHRAGRKG